MTLMKLLASPGCDADLPLELTTPNYRVIEITGINIILNDVPRNVITVWPVLNYVDMNYSGLLNYSTRVERRVQMSPQLGNRLFKRYSQAFKQKVFSEIETGVITIDQTQKLYRIGSNSMMRNVFLNFVHIFIGGISYV